MIGFVYDFGSASSQQVQDVNNLKKVAQIRSKDWSVTTDLKDAYFHISILPQHRKFLRFTFRGKAYQYRVLPFSLALSPHTFTKCMDVSVLSPAQRVPVFRGSMEFKYNAGTFIPCTYRVDSHGCEQNQARLSHHCQAQRMESSHTNGVNLGEVW